MGTYFKAIDRFADGSRGHADLLRESVDGLSGE